MPRPCSASWAATRTSSGRPPRRFPRRLFQPRPRMRLHILRSHGVAAFRTGQHRAEVMLAGEMPVQHRRAPTVVVIAVAPVHQAEDNRVEIANLVKTGGLDRKRVG